MPEEGGGGRTLLLYGVGGAAAVSGALWAASRASPTFALYWRLWRTLGQVAAGRLVGRASEPLRRLLPLPPLPGDDTVSASWLTSVLRRHGMLEAGARVDRVRLETWTGEAFGGGHGSTCRVVVEYSAGHSRSGKSAAGVNPPSLVLKRSHGGVLRAWTAVAGGQQREVLFHRHFGEELAVILDAPLYGAVGPGGFALLTPEVGGTPLHRYMGAQLEFFGMLSPQALGSFTAVDALMEAFRAAAALHASHWNDPALLATPWLKGAGWYRGTDRGAWEQGMELARTAWARLKALDLQGGLGFALSAKLAAVIDASYARSTWEAFQAALADPAAPFALIHGDFHAQNMMLRASGRSLSVFDWSEVGPGCPLTDLGQMMISDVRPEVWRSHGQELLHGYWRALVDGGVDARAFPFERCCELYETAGVQKWLWLFPIMAKFVPPASLVFFQSQLEAFIADHGDHPSYQIHSSMLLLV
eukprot:jgi/Tetstr1/421194/TSEL_001100.t1